MSNNMRLINQNHLKNAKEIIILIIIREEIRNLKLKNQDLKKVKVIVFSLMKIKKNWWSP